MNRMPRSLHVSSALPSARYKEPRVTNAYIWLVAAASSSVLGSWYLAIIGLNCAQLAQF